ncbi:MAG: YfhO family protein [Cytophagales bacterium]|nr:YfhO family protein [Cytophagales bacterium]
MRIYFKKISPHIISILVFIVLLAIYFKPAFIENKQLIQNDVFTHRGVAKEIMDYIERTGKQALWTNSLFGGMPAYLIATAYFPDTFRYIQNIIFLGLPGPAPIFLISLAAFYFLLIVLDVKPWLAVIGAIAFAFSSYSIITIEAGHNGKILALAYIPFVMGSIFIAFRKNLFLGTALTALALGLHIRAGHYQIMYYMGITVVIFGIVELIYAYKEKTLGKFLKTVGVLSIAAILALGANIGSMLATYEYGKYSIRGQSELAPENPDEKKSTGLDKDYAFAWSYGIAETMTLLVPNFYGGSSTGSLDKESETYQTLKGSGVPAQQIQQFIRNVPLYRGDQPFTSGPTYFGAIICFLFVLGVLIVDGRIKYWLIAATILFVMLSWGRNFSTFNYLMFDYFPFYNKFRAVAMALVIAQFCVPLLGLLALDKVLNNTDWTDKNTNYFKKNILIAAGITAGVSLLIALFAGTGNYESPADAQFKPEQQWIVDAIRVDRESLLRSDAFRSFFLIALTAVVLYFTVLKKISYKVAVGIIGILILYDLWGVDKRYLNNEKERGKYIQWQSNAVEKHFTPTVADNIILQDKSLSYRVYNTTIRLDQDSRTSYFHKSIGGYSGAKMKRYQDIIEKHLWRNNVKVLNMLNAKYVITGDPKQPVQQNPSALGNAWFITEIEKVNNPDEEIEALTEFEPAKAAIIDISKFDVDKTSFKKAGSSIELVEYEPNYLVYKAEANEDGFVVFSEIYYDKGWNAFIDGKQANYVRANYILRAMEVPQGQHIIEYKFEPKVYYLSNKIMLVSSILFLCFFVGAVIYTIKTQRDKESQI